MKIHDLERWLEAESYAHKLNGKSLDSWLYCIGSLNYKHNEIDRRIEIHNDRHKHCFIWHWYMGNERIIVGGLILHGYEEVFSVEINSKNYPYWSLCT